MNPRTLEEALRPLDRPGRVWSTGAYVTMDEGFLFAGVLSPEALLAFAIGGRREQGESLLETLRREGREEANVDLEPTDAAHTCFLMDGTAPERVVLPESMAPRPTLVWTGPVPFEGRYLDYLCVAWKSRFQGRPRPSSEIDRLLWIDAESLCRSHWDRARILGQPVAPGTPIKVTGTAARAATWLNMQQDTACPSVRDALSRARKILSRHGAAPHLVKHSEKVTSVALALGRRLRATGHSLDLSQLATAAMCHDVGRTHADSRVAAGLEHARASAHILNSEGLDNLAPAVANHILPVIVNPGLRDDLLERVLFYADKVVGLEYMGIGARLDDFAARRPDLTDEIDRTRAPLARLQGHLASAAGLTTETLETLCYVAALSETVDPSG